MWDLLATEQQTHTGGGGGGGGDGTHRCSDSCCPSLGRELESGVATTLTPVTPPTQCPGHLWQRTLRWGFTSVAAGFFSSHLWSSCLEIKELGEKNQAAEKSPQAEKTKRKRAAAVRRLEFQCCTSILKTHTTRGFFFNPFKKLISVLSGERGRSYSWSRPFCQEFTFSCVSSFALSGFSGFLPQY